MYMLYLLRLLGCGLLAQNVPNKSGHTQHAQTQRRRGKHDGVHRRREEGVKHVRGRNEWLWCA